MPTGLKDKWLYRCECGRLLTDKMISNGTCAGHKMRYATSGSFWEWIQVKTGIIYRKKR